ncbi:hypothetical protein EVJ58_g3432 [Rhodofomes roseus]|uniref:Uncharacterized protein n=1 Tax=Rhodofomes roseus TaxID=34475 RepID=A0A4Y9YKM7_9APHY|nr:hypothetical protein EVJ58_g3432 [Rhodofomes roseus]
MNIDEDEWFHSKLYFLRHRPDVCGYIKELVISSRCSASYRETEGAPSVPPIKFLENVIKDGLFRTGLKKLEWEAEQEIPASFSETVQTAFPNCTWVVSKYTGNPLSPMPTLTTLRSVVHLHADPLLGFQPVLLRSPQLRVLDVAAYQQRGCVMHHYEAPPFLRYDPHAAASQKAYPLIEELTIRDFGWSEHGARVCLQTMRWSHLRRLELLRGSGFALLQGCIPARETLPALEDFKLVTWYMRDGQRHQQYLDTLKQFLTMAPGLRDLHLAGPWQPLVPVITKCHGQTLRSLVVHEHERAQEPQRTTLQLSDLITLGKHCVVLEHLGIDVEADYSLPGSSGGESLATVVNSKIFFPALRHITLWTPLGIMKQRAPLRGLSLEKHESTNLLDNLQRHAPAILDPSLGNPNSRFRAILALFKSSQHRVSGKPRIAPKSRTLIAPDGTEGNRGKLDSVTVNIGEQDRLMGGGYPAGWVIWEQNARTQRRLQKTHDKQFAIHVYGMRGLAFRRSSAEPSLLWSVTHENEVIEAPSGPLGPSLRGLY